MTAQRWPGWHRDPDDPTLLRHWNGRHWDGRRRHVPSWSIATGELEILDPSSPPVGARPDGPASPAAISATASPTGRAAGPRRRPLPSAGAQRSAVHPADVLPQRTAPASLGPWGPPRRRAVAVALVLALLLVSISSALSGVGRRRSPASAPADATFAHAANADCAAVMGAVRPATVTTASLLTVGTAAADLERLATAISTLGRPAALGRGVRAWLDDWRAWARARLAEARAPGPERARARSAALEARRADAYAQANALSDCILAAGDVPAMVSVP
ncbi:MAG: hypothetical protein ACYDEN_06375 [Acidimicrobiales bacterium]